MLMLSRARSPSRSFLNFVNRTIIKGAGAKNASERFWQFCLLCQAFLSHPVQEKTTLSVYPWTMRKTIKRVCTVSRKLYYRPLLLFIFLINNRPIVTKIDGQIAIVPRNRWWKGELCRLIQTIIFSIFSVLENCPVKFCSHHRFHPGRPCTLYVTACRMKGRWP